MYFHVSSNRIWVLELLVADAALVWRVVDMGLFVRLKSCFSRKLLLAPLAAKQLLANMRPHMQLNRPGIRESTLAQITLVLLQPGMCHHVPTHVLDQLTADLARSVRDSISHLVTPPVLQFQPKVCRYIYAAVMIFQMGLQLTAIVQHTRADGTTIRRDASVAIFVHLPNMICQLVHVRKLSATQVTLISSFGDLSADTRSQLHAACIWLCLNIDKLQNGLQEGISGK